MRRSFYGYWELAPHVPLPSLFEFDHLENEEVRAEQIEEILRDLGEKDQQKIFRIVKVFREG